MTKYELIRTADELRKAIETLSSQPVVGLDTETTELDPYTSRLRLIQLATPDLVYIIDFDKFADADTRKSEALEPFGMNGTDPVMDSAIRISLDQCEIITTPRRA